MRFIRQSGFVVAAAMLLLGMQVPAHVAAATPAAMVGQANAPTSRAAGTANLTVGTFNVHKSTPDLPATARRLNLIAQEILRSEFDVVALQEAGPDMLAAIYSRVSQTYEKTSAANLKQKNTTGRTIFYRRATMRSTGQQGVVTVPSPVGVNFAVYQFVQHIPTGASFLFVSVHLLNKDGAAATEWRRIQTTELLASIDRINPTRLPVVIGGDMNSNRAPKYGYDAPTVVAKSRGMADALQVVGRVRNGNYNSFNGLSVRPRTGGYHVDHVFVSESVAVAWAEVMVRLSGKRYAKPFASDHNPIRAGITIRF